MHAMQLLWHITVCYQIYTTFSSYENESYAEFLNIVDLLIPLPYAFITFAKN